MVCVNYISINLGGLKVHKKIQSLKPFPHPYASLHFHLACIGSNFTPLCVYAIYIYIYIYIYTHTHIYTYIYIYVLICICFVREGKLTLHIVFTKQNNLQLLHLSSQSASSFYFFSVKMFYCVHVSEFIHHFSLSCPETQSLAITNDVINCVYMMVDMSSGQIPRIETVGCRKTYVLLLNITKFPSPETALFWIPTSCV